MFGFFKNMIHLSKGSLIFRGSSTEPQYAKENKKPNYMRNLPVYFAENKETANAYGQVIRYKVTKDLALVDMSDPVTITGLMEHTNSDIVRRSFAKAFRVSNGQVKRFSRIKYDIYVAAFLCQLGFDGYYAPRLKNAKTTQGTFHPEIVLCNPKTVLVVDKIYKIKNPPSMRVGVNENLTRRVIKNIGL